MVPPDVFLRCFLLTKNDIKELSDRLNEYITTLPKCELYICPLVDWVQENAVPFILKNEKKETKEVDKSRTFTRMWIYSHHIYSKIKRKDIINFSGELKLSGFSMPGKPGIIVIEGETANVEEFWRRIRSMTWKHIVMKERTDLECFCDTLDKLRSFEGFKEMSFEPKAGRCRDYHMDLGLLLVFLKEHGFEDMFEVYFGVRGT